MISHRFAGLGLVAAGWLACAGTGAVAAETATQLVADKSQIVFVSKQMGVPVEGAFGKFTARVAFDPKKPEGGSVALAVDMGSASLGVPQTDAELPKPDWFDALKFPQADFKSSSIKGLGGGRFEIAGKLTIKNISRPITVPVSIAPANGHAVASGSFTIQRLDYKVGDGEWTDTSVVGNEVLVRFKFTLAGFGPL